MRKQDLIKDLKRLPVRGNYKSLNIQMKSVLEQMYFVYYATLFLLSFY